MKVSQQSPEQKKWASTTQRVQKLIKKNVKRYRKWRYLVNLEYFELRWDLKKLKKSQQKYRRRHQAFASVSSSHKCPVFSHCRRRRRSSIASRISDQSRRSRSPRTSPGARSTWAFPGPWQQQGALPNIPGDVCSHCYHLPCVIKRLAAERNQSQRFPIFWN